MIPGTWSVIHKLGIGSEIDASGQQQKVGAMFNLFDQREYLFGLAREVPECVPENRGRYYAWNVLRSKFDDLLLRNAERQGAHVLQPAAVEQVLFENERAAGVLLSTDDGNCVPVSARMVVDASGRDCHVARRLGIRNPDPKLNKIAYFAHYRGAYHPPGQFIPIWIFAFEGGWVWYFSMMDDLTSVGAVVDPAYAKLRQGRDLWAFFDETIQKVPYVGDWLKGSEPDGELHAISALSYLADRFVGNGWLLAGDAAGFIDPIFSSGIHLAMKCGDCASQSILRAFDRGDFSASAFADYERSIRDQMNVIFPMIYRWYDALRKPQDALSLFDHAQRFSFLRRQVHASLVGALEAVAYDPSFRFDARMRMTADV